MEIKAQIEICLFPEHVLPVQLKFKLTIRVNSYMSSLPYAEKIMGKTGPRLHTP